MRSLLRLARSRPVRVVFLLAAVALAAVAVARREDQVRAALERVDTTTLVLALLAAAANVVVAAAAWRTVLADLGFRLPVRAAARTFLVGQLGKYLPGSVWQVVASAELAADHGVPRRTSAASSLVALLVTSATGVLLGGLLPLMLPPGTLPAWVVRSSPVIGAGALLLLLPPVWNRLAHRVTTLLRLPPTGELQLRGLLGASAWNLLSWVCAGLMTAALAAGLGAGADLRLVLLATVAYACAWVAGTAAVFVPAGVGVREVVLAAALASELDAGVVLVVVILARLVTTTADLVLALGAALWAAGGDGVRAPGR